ncbi:MAG: CopG family transcriptional regulator [Bryobacteraceae bacterium]
MMRTTVELPEAALRQIEMLAGREGTTPGDLIRRIVEDHVARCQPSAERRVSVSLPLIPASETGPIRPITGKDVDVPLSDEARQATPLE